LIQTETLDLLEWNRLCQHLATFAATKLGVTAARNLVIPSDRPTSQGLLAQTREIYNLEQKLNSGWTFDGIRDIGEALERSRIGGMLSGEELLNLATTLAGVRKLRRIIDAEAELVTLNELITDLRTYPELEQEIHHCIDDRGDVADRASPKLSGIRSQIKELRERIYQTLNGIIQRQSGAIQEAVITQRVDRFVIPVKAPQKDAIPGIVHDTSSTGATLYIEPKAIVDLGNRLRQAARQEQREIEIVLQSLSDKVAIVVEDLEQMLAIATILDLATARARYSLWLEANPPRFIDYQDGETVTLRQLRHPLLVWQQRHEQGFPVIPIDVRVQPKLRVVAITGPNTGGKTVTLKTIGLAALMAKVGLFIPAKEPVEMPWFEDILADIGDEQSLQQSLSTFSGHIRRIGRIIDALSSSQPLVEPEYYFPPTGSADENQESVEIRDDRGIKPTSIESISSISPSLVLLDEVGAGTDPVEGTALAISILKYLADRAQLTIATTHYGELKALKYQDDRFENASVEFDDNSLQPTYRLLWGIPGRSNALSIAQRLGLKQEIVDRAKNTAVGDKQDVNQVIAALEAQRREQEQKALEAKQLLEQTELFYEEVSTKAAAIKERERELKSWQDREVQQSILNAKSEIAKVIRQLQRGEQTGQNAGKATESIDKIADKFLSKPDPKPAKPSYIPKIGEKVRIPHLGQTGDVLSLEQEQGQVTIRFGIMKMTLSFADIESLDGKKAEVPVKQKPANPPPAAAAKPKQTVLVRTSQNTIDLRGCRVADAEMDLDRSIQTVNNTGVLWVVHGKGTGKLREGIHEYLKRHPQVERFETAPQNEGSTGVTIVYLT
jgi:DNA mismatch repair protein MutS2